MYADPTSASITFSFIKDSTTNIHDDPPMLKFSLPESINTYIVSYSRWFFPLLWKAFFTMYLVDDLEFCWPPILSNSFYPTLLSDSFYLYIFFSLLLLFIIIILRCFVIGLALILFSDLVFQAIIMFPFLLCFNIHFLSFFTSLFQTTYGNLYHLDSILFLLFGFLCLLSIWRLYLVLDLADSTFSRINCFL